MICATHSHTGPLFDDVRRDQFHKTAVLKDGKDQTEPIYYPDFLSAKLVQVISRSTLKAQVGGIECGNLEAGGTEF